MKNKTEVIQSLSICSYVKECINNCPFCISKTRNDDHLYENNLDMNNPNFAEAMKGYKERLIYVRSKGCDSIIITGTNEPQTNKLFLSQLGIILQNLPVKFTKIEMQTTGVGIDKDYLKFLKEHVGVNTISLSISSVENNSHRELIEMPKGLDYNLINLCKNIKDLGLTLRLSMNISDVFLKATPDAESLFDYCKKVQADQLTIRVLYAPEFESPQTTWIRENTKHADDFLKDVENYVRTHGRKAGQLPYGQVQYYVDNVSTVIDDDCMAKESKKEYVYKYYILRQDGKLYSQWDDPASLIY